MYRILLLALFCLSATAGEPADWATPAETAEFKTTPDYATTLAYLERLRQAAPDKMRIASFGHSAMGRPLTVVIANNKGVLEPKAARRTGKAVVMIQAGIHAGEIEGKDAGLALLRDALVTDKLPDLLDDVVLVFIPVFNVDGHENASPYNRINQNGPAEMGFRGTAQYLNLNRDYIKAESPEMRAWLKLWQHWQPDFYVDVHTTDGADYQYDITWYTEDADKLPAPVAVWQEDMLARAFAAFEKQGYLASIYLNFVEHDNPAAGIRNFGSGPRYSTGYAALQNRPALLIETHMLKPYRQRVDAVHDLLVDLLRETAASRKKLHQANAAADRAVVERASDPHASLAVQFEPSRESTEYLFKAYDWSITKSDISGGNWIRYHRDQPKTIRIPNWNDLVVSETVALPAAYAVPAQWPRLIDTLKAHGVRLIRLDESISTTAQAYRLSHAEWASRPFEGHLMLEDFEQSVEQRSVTLPAGSVLVPLDQRAANVAVHVLEPAAPDALLRWGALNAIFEAKEYGEPRVLEQLARDMLAKNPGLQAEFENARKTNPEMAENPYARLMFFYRRSPWYQVQGIGAYPVLRLDSETWRRLRQAPQHELP